MARHTRRTGGPSATANWSRGFRCMSIAKPNVPRREGGSKVIGENLARIDIPAKVSGGEAYLQDMRLPGMLHARVVRGPSDGTRLKPADIEAVARMPGVVQVVRHGRFTAIVADDEWQRGEGAASPAGGRLGARRRASAGKGHARGDPRHAGPGCADLRLSRPAGTGRRAHVARTLQPALPDARLDRSVLRRGAVGRRQRDRVDPQPGRLSAAQGARRAARRFRSKGCAASMSRARAATATTAPTMPRPMQRSPPAPCPASRCACNGCASRSMAGSRSARR